MGVRVSAGVREGSLLVTPAGDSSPSFPVLFGPEPSLGCRLPSPSPLALHPLFPQLECPSCPPGCISSAHPSDLPQETLDCFSSSAALEDSFLSSCPLIGV